MTEKDKLAVIPPMVVDAKRVPRREPSHPLKRLETVNKLQLRALICIFLLVTVGFSTVCCFTLIFLQGFHAFGFTMDETFLKGLYVATVAQVVGFLGVFVHAVWSTSNKSKGIEPRENDPA